MGKKVDLETKLGELEKIVTGLESGEMSLDSSIKNYEAGVKLYNECKAYLGEVEKKIQVLSDSLEENDIEK